eukprot:TRINITY_DN782068_c0_g1_i1.p1 TRINITY_DN782068_c0_g1~~TRINITY_DN782068_c0_g1_i1.p1  ORF type:complete len:188 (-),score=68.06 TRINITY_DN782068_c0_g1_i1:224-787(-)
MSAIALKTCSNPSCENVEQKAGQFSKCSACKSVHYCSKECQVTHWKSGHKAECKIAKAKLAKTTKAVASMTVQEKQNAEMKELQDKHNMLLRQLTQTRAQLVGEGRRKQMQQLSLGALDKFEDDVKIHKAVGKMYMKTTLKESMEESGSIITACDESMQSLKKKEDFLEKKFQEAKKNIQEFTASLE